MAILFDMLLRAKKLILVSFVLIFTALLILLSFKKDKYQAQMTFLIRSERATSLVSADPSEKALQQEVETEEKVNSEVALLTSAEILKAVVLDTDLEKPYLNASGSNQAVAVEQAAGELGRTLKVNGVRKSALIDVSYISHNRDQAKAVLDALSKEYLNQYARLHSSGGAATFYTAESNALEAQLLKDQDERAKLLAGSGYDMLPEAQQARFARITSLENSLADTEATLAETGSRLRKVYSQEATNPQRILTQQRVVENATLVSALTAKLADQTDRLTAMESKFLDNDPAVLELKREVANTQAALAAAQTVKSQDVMTDINPLRQTLNGEANTLNQTVAGLTSRQAAIQQELATEKGAIASTEQGRIRVDELSREIKVLQDSVDLYQGRAVAAAAAEEMDPQKFSNIVEASHPTVPILPMSSRFNVRSSFVLALLMSLAIGLAWEWYKEREFAEAASHFPVYEGVVTR